MRSRGAVGLAIALALAAPSLLAQSAESPTTVSVTPGPRYKRGSLHRLVFGTRYRNVWNTPIEVPVLDLDTLGGGLTPLSQGGFGQTVTLAFDSREGTGFLFRSMDKRRGQGLEEAFRGTIVEQIVQDQTSSQLPGAAAIVAHLLDAAGIIHTTPVLVVLPDDARLGPFRDEFAGMLGTVEQLARTFEDGTPGFAGSDQIVGTAEFLNILESSPENRLDTREFLAARLIDILIGDRDRHAGQWLWARFPDNDGFTWRTIPLDHDEAFIALDGFAMAMARARSPKLVSFGREYPSIRGLTWNAWDLDRHLLIDLDRSTWDSVTTAVQARMTDRVIEDAVRKLPEPVHDRIGEDLEAALKERRDDLPSASSQFYELVAKYVDVYATDSPEQAVLEHTSDGAVELTIRREGFVRPFFVRRFVPSETREIRLYLGGGNDRVVVRGTADKRIRVHIVGGQGDDVLADSSAARGNKTWFHDGQGQNVFRAQADTRVDGSEYQRPPSPEPFHRFTLDWGSRRNGATALTTNSDHGLIVASGFQWTHYAFRKDPYRSRQLAQLGVSTSGRFVGRYVNHMPNVLDRVDAYIRLSANGTKRVRFFGFGNETDDVSTRARVDQYTFQFTPSLTVYLPSRTELDIGPIFKIVDTQRRVGSVLDDIRPYGEDLFAQVGMRSRLRLDWRDHPTWPRSGLLFEAEGSLYPPFLDAQDAFGSIGASVAGYVTVPNTDRVTFAGRVGGRKTLGLVPFHEAAYLGGQSDIRGYTTQRFAGDASLFANAELRFWVAKVFILMPIDVGSFVFADVGRVFVDGESSSLWHADGGIGLWLAPFNDDYTVSAHLAKGEAYQLRFEYGFDF